MKTSMIPSSLYSISPALAKKYLLTGFIFVLIIIFLRLQLSNLDSPTPGGSQKALEGHSGGCKAPVELVNRGPYRGTYTTNFSLGCPQQPFIGTIDICNTPLFVPSRRCTGECPYGPKYDSAASSSYRKVGTGRHGSSETMRGESVDILTIAGGLQVPNQHFSEIHYFDPDPDGPHRRSSVLSELTQLTSLDLKESYSQLMFGLAVDFPWMERVPEASRPTTVYPHNSPSPFRTMIEEGVLEKNMFSLRLPRDETDEGHLMFGGYDASFNGDLISHPIFPPGTKHWSVEASSISLTTSEVLFNQSLVGYQAILSTRFSALYFPEPLLSQISKAIKTTPRDCRTSIPSVDCDDISNPVLTIGVREQKIDLRAIPEMLLLYDPPPVDGNKTDKIMLGSAFLESVYSVFDHDLQTISFATLKN